MLCTERKEVRAYFANVNSKGSLWSVRFYQNRKTRHKNVLRTQTSLYTGSEVVDPFLNCFSFCAFSWSAFLLYGKTGKNFRVKGTVQFSSVKIERNERVPFTPSYSLRDWVLTIGHLTNMAAGFALDDSHSLNTLYLHQAK